jgi:hypothetical protein
MASETPKVNRKWCPLNMVPNRRQRQYKITPIEKTTKLAINIPKLMKK